MNLLRELACARRFSKLRLDGFFRDRDLWQMVTKNAAAAVGLEDQLGALVPGATADIAIFELRSRAAPFTSVVAAGVENVLLVLRGGTPLYGDAELLRGLGESCEPIDVCGAARAVCLDTGTTFTGLVEGKADAYDLFSCGPPEDEPTCVPSRPGRDGKPGYGRPTKSDPDGDGVATPDDNCPRIFNPVRPMDHGAQADADRDGVGDVCDPTPMKP
jgi:hypothetical protein